MSLKQKFEQKQIQKLIMTPALQEAINLLPLPNLELIEIINQQLAQNPLLEIKEETKNNQEISEPKDLKSNTDEEKVDFKKEDEVASKNDIDEQEFNNILKDYFEEGRYPQSYYEEKDLPSLENTVSHPLSLWDHLMWQANLTFFSKREKAIAEYIIGNVNQDGYLEISVEELAKACKTSKEKIERIRRTIMNFDPVGVGSLNLKECLLTQLENLGMKDKILEKIIKEYLSLLEKHNYQELADELGISLSQLKHYLNIIKSLNPKPGTKFTQKTSDYMVPDIFVEKDENGFKVYLNKEGVPQLRINPYYRNLLVRKAQVNPDLKKYLEEKLKSAIWFLRSLEQRNKTIYKVAQYAVEKQRDFLEKGFKWLKPLTLAEVAEAINVHESTVSRVVSNKYILTPQGLLPLKFFFPKKIIDGTGREFSSELIKEKIFSLIKNEDPNRPLSDADIVDILAKSGISLARRTVAKYRKQLKIPSSRIRKRTILMEGLK